MTDIEKKAREYAEEAFSNVFLDEAKTWNEVNEVFVQTFLAGAAYALGNQWRDAEKEKPEDGEYVLVHTKYGIVPAVWNERYNCWDDADGDDYMYSAETVDAWLPIPDYKPKEE